MTARHQTNLGEADIVLSSRSLSEENQNYIALDKNIGASSELQESMGSFLGGISGLLFAISLIFFFQAPLISGGLLLALMSGWGGAAWYQVRKEQVKS